MRIAIAAALMLTAGVAAADEPATEKPTAALVDVLIDQRETLRRFELVAMGHADKVRKAGAERDALVDELVTSVIERRGQLATAAENAEVRAGDDPKIAAPLHHLIGDLYMDQWESIVRIADIKGLELGDGSDAEVVRKLGIKWYEKLAEEFPSYARLGVVLDQLSQLYFDRGDYARAKQALQRMLCANRDRALMSAQAVQGKAGDDYAARVYAQTFSIDDYGDCRPRIRDRELIDDGWMRLGWLHRSGTGELALAVSAYEQASDDPRSPSYFVALQELAATHYESGRLIDAIPPLDALVDYLDGLARRDPDAYDDTLAAVRGEAVARAGGIIAELWRESALPAPEASLELAQIYFRGREGEAHVRDVFEALGGALRDLGAYEQAETVWRHVLATWPRHARVPVVHDRLVQLLVETGNPARADAEREALLAALAPKATWRATHRSGAAAERADAIVDRTLLALASGRFREAEVAHQARPDAPTGADLALYREAARHARRVADRFPRGPHRYEAAFRLASLARFRGDHADAGRQFRRVLELDPTGKHALDAGRLMVDSYERAVEAGYADGSLTRRPLPGKKELASGSPQAVPPLLVELRRAYVDYASEVTRPGEAATALYKAAAIDLAHLQLDRAESQLQAIVRQYCQTSAARDAATRLSELTGARAKQSIGQAAQNLLNQACGDNRPVQLVRKARLRKLTVEAKRLVAAGRHLEAGRRYYDAFRETSPSDPAHAPALLASAVAFADAGRAEVATKLLGLFATDAALARSPQAPRATWRAAQAYEQLIDYRRAVDAYLAVARMADRKARSDSAFDLPARGREALWRAAELRELDRVYYDKGGDPGAATLFIRYAEAQAGDRELASEAYLRAGAVYLAAGDPARLVATYKAWRGKLGSGKAAVRFHVRFNYQIAKARLAAGDRRAAATAFLEVVDQYRKLGQRSDEEAALAAEAQFWRAEDAYQRMLADQSFAWPADGDPKESERRITALGAAADKIEKQFKAVLDYDTAWSVAARVRIGDVYIGIVDQLVEARPPKKLVDAVTGADVGALDVWAAEIRKAVKPIVDGAGDHWREAENDARKRGVTNRWARLARQRLNSRIDAARYPVQRDEIVARETSP